jgi:hypothetical protein
MIVLLSTTLGNRTYGQSADTKVERTTLCNIVNHPADFIGKTIEVRAQVWADEHHLFWMNESSIQLDKACRFLQAANAGIGDRQTGFGTFHGRIVMKSSHAPSTLLGSASKGLGIIFLVEESSDVHLRRDYFSGPTPILQLYDPKTATFVRPQD